MNALNLQNTTIELLKIVIKYVSWNVVRDL